MMRRIGLGSLLLPAITVLLHGGGCRQITGLDQFQVQSCVPGEDGCSLAPEDCVAQQDTNGDGALPPRCSGEPAWLRMTDGTAKLGGCYEPPGLTSYSVAPSRHLAAAQSFGKWFATAGSVRGTAGGCVRNACVYEAHGYDAEGEDVAFKPPVPCEDGQDFEALARGDDHAFAGTVDSSTGQPVVVLTSHRLTDGTLASKWSWTPPAAVSSFALAAGASAVVAVGQPDGVLFARPDPSFPAATYHALPGLTLAAMALARGTPEPRLLLAGAALDPASDPGPCALGATAPTFFIARAKLGAGSKDPAMPAAIGCTDFALKVGVDGDTGSPATALAAGPAGRACWAYAGTDGTTNVRTLRVGCTAGDDGSAAWRKSVALGDDDKRGVSIAVDPFGHAIVAASVTRKTALSWEGESIAVASASEANILVAKLRGDTGALVWGRMVAGGDARGAKVGVADNGWVQLAAITDGPALRGEGVPVVTDGSGIVLAVMGFRP